METKMNTTIIYSTCRDAVSMKEEYDTGADGGADCKYSTKECTPDGAT
jgi:hypothetical protein